MSAPKDHDGRELEPGDFLAFEWETGEPKADFGVLAWHGGWAVEDRRGGRLPLGVGKKAFRLILGDDGEPFRLEKMSLRSFGFDA